MLRPEGHGGRFTKNSNSRNSTFDPTSSRTTSDPAPSKTKTSSDTHRRSILGWFRHKGDPTSTKTSDSDKKKLKRNASSLSRVGYLSDSMPSLALRSLTNSQRPQTDSSSPRNSPSCRDVTTATLAVPRRTQSSATRRAQSGRNRWSSYELTGAAILSEVDEQADARVDNDEGLTISRVHSEETVNHVDDPDITAPAAPLLIVSTVDSTPTELHTSHHDELLERLRVIDDQLESCRTKQRRLLTELFQIPSSDLASLAELARLRSRDHSDRCVVLLSLLSDAERLTSYVNSLLHVDEQQGPSYRSSDNGELITNETTGSSNGDYCASGLAKTLLDFSVSLRTGLCRLSVDDYGDVHRTNIQLRPTNVNDVACSSTTNNVATPGECKYNSLDYYADCPLSTGCDDVLCTDVSTADNGKMTSLSTSETSGTSRCFNTDTDRHLLSTTRQAEMIV